MVYDVLAGLVVGGAAGAFDNDQRADARRQERSIENSTRATLRAAFQNDPLMQRILGALEQNQGAPFDPNEIFEIGQEQLGKVRERREFDSLRSLAATGIDQGSAQSEFFDRALQQQQGLEQQALRQTVDSAAIQARPQALTEGFGLGAQLLSERLGIGANLGILGQDATHGELTPEQLAANQNQPLGAPINLQEQLPSNLQSQFFFT